MKNFFSSLIVFLAVVVFKKYAFLSVTSEYWQFTIVFSFVSCCVLLSSFYRLILSSFFMVSRLIGFLGCLLLQRVVSRAVCYLHFRDSLYYNIKGAMLTIFCVN